MSQPRTFLSLGEAAKETGKNKSIISRAIKSGKMSAQKNEDGHYSIDPAELFRVFPKGSEQQLQKEEKQQQATHDSNSSNTLRVKELELEVKFLDKEKNLIQEQIKKTEQERDDWKQQAQKLLLTHEKPEQPAPQPVEDKKEKDSPLLWAILGAAVFLLFLVVAMNFYPEIMRLVGSK
jgi:hypothetical protein